MTLTEQLYHDATELVRREQKVSHQLIQRNLRVSFAGAQVILDELENRGVIGPYKSGGEPRDVLIEPTPPKYPPSPSPD